MEMRTITPMHRRDEGFTYAEMLVAMTLMLIVMSIMWAGLQVAQKGTDVSQKQANFEQNIAGPMQAFDKVLSQNISLDTNGLSAYALSFTTDQNNDGQNERHVIVAGSDGSLTETVYLTNPTNPSQNISTLRTVKWSTQNHNVAGNIPMFTFMNSGGTVLPVSAPASVATSSTQVAVTISSAWDGHTFRDTRRVWFRNR
jgi:type II secretory pathway component PulJ